MIVLRRLALAALALPALLAPRGPAAAGDAAEFVRVLEMTSKVAGSWSGRFAAKAGEGDLVGVALAADWWDGPGDPRVADPKLSALPGVTFEVKRGEGPWVPLPPVDRDLRLTARAAAPADLSGGSPDGEWQVRQKAGGAYPRTLRLEFTCRGDPLLVKDLRVKSLDLPGLDPEPVLGRPHFPDRQGNRTLKPGDAVEAVIVVENCGARKTREVDLDLLAAPYGKRQGPRMGFAQVPALDPGGTATLRISGKIPEDLAKEPGVFEILAVVNPRTTEREVELFNNALGRAFKFVLPEVKDPLDPDVRNR